MYIDNRNMDYRTKEKICRRISTAKLLEKFNNSTLCFTDPDQNLLAEADFFYNCFYEDNKNRLMTFERSIEILKEKGRWSDKKDKEVETIQKQISLLKDEVYNCRFLIKKKQKLEKTIEEAEYRMESLLKIKSSLFTSTVEYLGEVAKRNFIIEKICTINGSKLPNDASILNEVSTIYFDKNAIDEKQIREIARTNPWRIFWNTSKELSSELFGCPATLMTQYQQHLVMWSFIYDSAFQSQNRPSDDIINNDIMFDKWYQDEQKGKNKQDNSKSNAFHGGYGGQEVFITADKEGAKKIYAEENDDDAKRRIAERRKVIKEKGIAQDTDFKDIRRDIKIQQNRSFYAKG